MLSISFNEKSIDLANLLAAHSEPQHGAQSVFIGRVRDHNQGRRVVSLSYDVFAPLAEKILKALAEEAITKWGPDLQITIEHRVGHLQVGDPCVVIIVSAPHRDEAYQASRFLIEGVKHKAPIWKKETYEDGESDWLEGHSLCSRG